MNSCFENSHMVAAFICHETTNYIVKYKYDYRDKNDPDNQITNTFCAN